MFTKFAARDLGFLLFLCLSLVPFGGPIAKLASLSLHDEKYSHIILVPLISLCLVIWQRKSIFADPRYCPLVGMLCLLPGVILYGIAQVGSFSLSQNDRLFLAIGAIVSLWIAGFETVTFSLPAGLK